jgi:MoxR-like ATPase
MSTRGRRRATTREEIGQQELDEALKRRFLIERFHPEEPAP